MKKFIFLLLLLFSSQIHAQDDDETVNLDSIFPIDPYYYQLAADSCRHPHIEASIIHYEGYSKVFLDIKQEASNQQVYYKTMSPNTQYTAANVLDGKVLLNGLLPNELYTLQMANSCGVVSDIAVIDTKREPEEFVTVSLPFYGEIVKYLKDNQNTPFDQFLGNLTTINPYEKIAFVQQFFYNGEPFETDGGLTIPPIPDRGGGDTCFCNSIRTSQLAFPSNQNATTGIITEFSQPGSGPNGTNLGGDSNASTWFWLNNKGAAKWHNMWTQGYKSKKGVDYERRMTWADGTTSSYQQSYLRITLLCLDGDKIPKACECEKNVSFWYRYNTRVKAVANIYNVSGSENSIAQVEDMAMATFWEEFNPASFQGLNMLRAEAESHCDRTPNPAFWTNGLQLLANGAAITAAILGATQGQDSTYSAQELAQIASLVQSFFETMAAVITTPYQNPTDCDNEDERDGEIHGSISKKLKPNTPIVLAINSFSKLYSGGRRAWHSYARINSSHHITAFVHHDAFGGVPRHCCSPRVGLWILGSCDGPWNTNQLKIEVADKLYQAGINNLAPSNQGNGHTVPFEFGYLWERSSIEDCNKIIIAGGERGDKSTLNGTLSEADLKDFQSLSVWDISGRIVADFSLEDALNFSSIKEMVDSKLQTVTPGVYIIRLIANGESISQKILIH